MGLDMYLTKHVFIGGKYDNKITGSCEIKHGSNFENGRTLTFDLREIQSIELSIAYWRKANAIHAWIVDHCWRGDYYDYHGEDLWFSEENMKAFISDIDAVLADHDKATELIPTREGFFFGSYDYDEYYFDDLKYTKEVLERCIADPDIYKTYYYSASW